MKAKMRIALIGDYRASVTAHMAIPPALELAAKSLGVEVEPIWVHTSKLTGTEEVRALRGYRGIWCVPASPYANTEGAIAAISLARTGRNPVPGNMRRVPACDDRVLPKRGRRRGCAHAELNPEAEHPLISKLSCSLVEVTGTIRLTPGSLAAKTLWVGSRRGRLSLQLRPEPEFRAIDSRSRRPSEWKARTMPATSGSFACATIRSSWRPFSSRNAPRCRVWFIRSSVNL
jgi:hypothetical protein